MRPGRSGVTVMCGRYRLSRRKQLIQEYFDTTDEVEWDARYNIAPTQTVPVIRQDPQEPIRRTSLSRSRISLPSVVIAASLICRRMPIPWRAGAPGSRQIAFAE